jgi:hypothetical protein
VSVLVGLAIWYPAGWTFPSSSLPPVQLIHGDTVFFGSFAAALAASLAVTRWLPRLAVLAVASGALWIASTPLPDPVPHEPALVAALLGAGQVLGLVFGTLLRRGPARLAFGLALVAASTTTERWLAPLLVATLAVSFLRVRAGGRGLLGAVVAAVGAAAVWLLGTLAHFSVSYGYGSVRRGTGYPTEVGDAVRRVLEPTLDWLRAGSETLAAILLRHNASALVAAVLAAVVVTVLRARAAGPDGGTAVVEESA